MDNDKIFAAYTLALVAGIGTLLTVIVSTGVAQVPPPLMFIEHLALGLAIRGAYKSYGGFNVSDWVPSFRTVPAADGAPVLPLEPATAGSYDDDEKLAA